MLVLEAPGSLSGDPGALREPTLTKRIAVYRDKENNLHKCLAVCPHMDGILHWNADEKTFDCPMHGSRFTADGKVINGPAIGDLKKVK